MYAKGVQFILRRLVACLYAKRETMSRSIKKTPKRAITSAETEKDNKRQANRNYDGWQKLKSKKGKVNYLVSRRFRMSGRSTKMENDT
jgi:hypothetical protein